MRWLARALHAPTSMTVSALQLHTLAVPAARRCQCTLPRWESCALSQAACGTDRCLQSEQPCKTQHSTLPSVSQGTAHAWMYQCVSMPQREHRMQDTAPAESINQANTGNRHVQPLRHKLFPDINTAKNVHLCCSSPIRNAPGFFAVMCQSRRKFASTNSTRHSAVERSQSWHSQPLILQ